MRRFVYIAGMPTLACAALLVPMSLHEKITPCEKQCDNEQVACIDWSVVEQDRCKDECKAHHPKYMICYWECRIEAAHTNKHLNVNLCLENCKGYGLGGRECTEACDNAYLENDDTCWNKSDQCQDTCHDF